MGEHVVTALVDTSAVVQLDLLDIIATDVCSATFYQTSVMWKDR